MILSRQMCAARTRSQSIRVMVVPGIMGTSLRYEGYHPQYHVLDQLIWSEELHENLRTLTRRPALMSDYTRVRPEAILRRLKGRLGMEIDLYGHLLDKLNGAAEGLGRGCQVTTFPYDWRASIEKSGQLAAEKINEITETSRLVIVAHSMGGLVIRDALHRLKRRALGRIHHFVQIATPVEGSVRAYKTLKNRPEMSDRFMGLVDFTMWTKFFFIKPAALTALQDVVKGFDSVYQLMPNEQVLHAKYETRNPYDLAHWPEVYHSKVRGAQELRVQKRFHMPNDSIALTAFFAACHKTPYSYEVDDNYQTVGRPKEVSGDGTVTAESAKCGPEGREIMKRDHRSIVASPQVIGYITELMAGGAQ